MRSRQGASGDPEAARKARYELENSLGFDSLLQAEELQKELIAANPSGMESDMVRCSLATAWEQLCNLQLQVGTPHLEVLAAEARIVAAPSTRRCLERTSEFCGRVPVLG